MKSDTVVSVLGVLAIGAMLGHFATIQSETATAAARAAALSVRTPVEAAPVEPVASPLTEPLTRAVYLNTAPCECTRYRMVSLAGTDHVAVIATGGELPTGEGGIAKPEFPE